MMIRAALQKARQRRKGDDSGFSLIETIVAMSIFAVFMGLVMSAIIAMMASTQKSTSLHDGTAALENVFQDLDHQVRYASGLNTPSSLPNGNWYVSWQSPATNMSPLVCTQLKWDKATSTLDSRTWVPGASPLVVTGWKILGSNIILDPTATQPFTLVNSNKTNNLVHEQLTVRLAARPNGSRASRSTQSVINATFTALNSAAYANVCPEVAPS